MSKFLRKRAPDIGGDGVTDVAATVEAGRAVHFALAPLRQSVDRDEVGTVLAIWIREHSPHALWYRRVCILTISLKMRKLCLT